MRHLNWAPRGDPPLAAHLDLVTQEEAEAARRGGGGGEGDDEGAAAPRSSRLRLPYPSSPHPPYLPISPHISPHLVQAAPAGVLLAKRAPRRPEAVGEWGGYRGDVEMM